MCHTIERFDMNAFGAVVEVCRCGQRRPIRGRTLNDVAQVEASFVSTVQREFVKPPSGRRCATPECQGWPNSRRTAFCPICCVQRAYDRRKEHMRRARAAAKRAKAA